MGSRDADGEMRNSGRACHGRRAPEAEPLLPPGRLDGYVENPSEHKKIGARDARRKLGLTTPVTVPTTTEKGASHARRELGLTLSADGARRPAGGDREPS